MFPFLFLAVYLEKRDLHAGQIGGKVAGKAGLKFVVTATMFLVLFQAIFFETTFKEYKINYMQTSGPQILKEQIAAGKLKIKEEEIPQIIANDVEGVTLFKEITSVVFKTIFYGTFCSLITAVAMRRKS